jgi:hypothetical protein
LFQEVSIFPTYAVPGRNRVDCHRQNSGNGLGIREMEHIKSELEKQELYILWSPLLPSFL